MPKSAVATVRLTYDDEILPPASSVFLPRPNLDRHSAELENGRFCVGMTAMQGWRNTMEDAHAIELHLTDDCALFAVFDGHGCVDSALMAAEHMASWIKRTAAFGERRYADALREAYICGDAEICEAQSNATLNGHVTLRARSGGARYSGTTAVTCLLTPTHVYCANVGDSRAVLLRAAKAMDLSRDHKPHLPEEQDRVQRCGGTIVNGRVNGMLAMTRALGDPMMKKREARPENQIVSGVPEVTSVELKETDVALVLACDGIWDCLTSQEVGNFFLEEMHEHEDYALMCENLCENLVAPTLHHFGTDNMTVMIVRLKACCRTPPLPMPICPSASPEQAGSPRPGSAGSTGSQPSGGVGTINSILRHRRTNSMSGSENGSPLYPPPRHNGHGHNRRFNGASRAGSATSSRSGQSGYSTFAK